MEPDAAAAEILLADLVQDQPDNGPGALTALAGHTSADHHKATVSADLQWRQQKGHRSWALSA